MLARPELMLKDERTGEVVRLDGGGHIGMDVFDFAQPAARAFFMSDCVNATLSGVVDGCYMDRSTGTTPVENLSAAQAHEYETGHITVRRRQRPPPFAHRSLCMTTRRALPSHARDKQKDRELTTGRLLRNADAK
jgi:hypothetical protein